MVGLLRRPAAFCSLDERNPLLHFRHVPTVDLAGVRLHYQRRGSGPAVLWVQGVGLAGGAWSPQVTRLADQFDCISVDNRGVGHSEGDMRELAIEDMANDLLRLIEHLGLSQVHVVGHSMGGVIAHEFALRNPARVRSLVLMCTFSRGKDATTLTATMLKHGVATSLGTQAMRRRAFARMVMPESYVENRGIDAVIAELEATFGRSLAEPPKVVGAQLRALSRHDASARLGELAAIPTLVLSGSHDPIARPIYGRRLAQGIGTARFVEVPDASHALPIQLPDLVHSELERHLHATQS